MLTIHLLIINSVLIYINLENLNFELSFILIGQVIILLSFYYLIFLEQKSSLVMEVLIF